MKISGMTKKQAKDKIPELIKDIDKLKNDLRKVTHPTSISMIKDAIETKEELLQAYKDHAGEWLIP